MNDDDIKKQMDEYKKVCETVQIAVDEYVGALDEMEVEFPGNYIVSMLGGNMASVFHNYFTPENRDEFKELLLLRFEEVINSLEGYGQVQIEIQRTPDDEPEKPSHLKVIK